MGNCRVAYVAQHAFFHIENHLEKTPMQIEYKTEEGQLRSLKCVFKRFTEGRRTANKSKEYEYEVRWQGASDFTTWVPKSKLEAHGFSKLLKHVDDKIAALATQLQRPLTQKFVESH